MVLLIGLLAVTLTPLRDVVQRPKFMRFGFEGPPRFVQLVQVDAVPAPDIPLKNVGKIVTTRPRGGEEGTARSGQRGTPSPTSKRQGLPGVEDDQASRDLVARALASRGAVPIFQSQELVIETLVRPQYPEEARERGIEGRVAVLALVDTLGRVKEAQVMDASGEPQLDNASRVAVMQCKFRPYRVEDRPREVYAVFRFSFRIY